jgi:hypothetical protein
MKLLTTFLFLLSFLLQGDRTGILKRYESTYSLHGYVQQVTLQSSITEKNLPFFESPVQLPGGNDILVFEEEDNEEENERKSASTIERSPLFLRKYISAGCYIALTNTLFSNRHISFAADCKWLSCRVLRI